MAPRRELGSMLSGDKGTDLVDQASGLLSRERFLSIPSGLTDASPGAVGAPSGSEASSWRAQPINAGIDPGRLRRQAHDMLETLLEVFSPKGDTADRVPVIRCAAPVAAGQDGRIAVRVANDEETPSEVTLYCTNLAADSGYDIPALRVSISPHRSTIAPKGEATFEVKIAVPQQTPAGIYSGLIQATGAQYVKAVVSVQVA